MSVSDTNDPNGGDAAATQDGAADDDAFEAALDEALAQKGEPPAQAGGDPDDPADDQSDGEGKPGSDGSEARADQPAGGNEPPAGQPSTDIWQDAPEHLRAAYEAALAENQGLSTKVNRLIGQVSAADRQLARLRAERGTTPGTNANDQGQDAQATDPFEDEGIKRFQEEYGEIADPVLKLLKAQAEQIAALQAPVAEVTQQREAQARTSEIEVFTKAHPDWETYVNDERYPTWLAEQPKAVREAAQRAITVEDGTEAAWLLSQFKASIGAGGGTAPAADQGQNNRRTSPSPIDLKRQRQLGAGRDGGGSATPVQSGATDDFEGALAEAEARSERRRNQGFR